MQEAEKIWMNGELVDWADAKVHVLSHGLHYGSSVFEGIRAYDAEGGTAVFRLEDHLARLEQSAAIYYMPLPYSRDELRTAVLQVLSANALGGCYIRPIAMRVRRHGPFPLEAPVDVPIAPGRGRVPGWDGLKVGHRSKIARGAASGRPRCPPRQGRVSTSTRSWRSRDPHGRLRRGPAAQRAGTWPTAPRNLHQTCATAN